jgi:hypothetical protein
MYFAMNQDDVDNDIAYVADVEEIISYTQPTVAPCKNHEYPGEWTGVKYNIWIKIKNLQRENSLSANDFVVASTGNNLKGVIQRGQYIFGYITKGTYLSRNSNGVIQKDSRVAESAKWCRRTMGCL